MSALRRKVRRGGRGARARGGHRGTIAIAAAALVAGYMLAFVVRYGTAVVVGDLRADLGAGEAALGLLAAAYFWPYALVQPVAGVLSDTLGARRAVPAFLLAAACGTALFAAAPSFPVALVGRALGGLGVGIVYVCGISVIGRWVDPARFGLAAGLFSASGIVGGFVAARPLAGLVDALGWRGAFAVVAVALAGVAALSAAALPRPERDGTASPAPPVQGLRRALRLRDLWLTAVYAFVVLGVLSSMQGLWTVPFLQDVHGLDDRRSATILEAWSVGLLVGIPLWGVIADRVPFARKWTIAASVSAHGGLWTALALFPAAWPSRGLYALFLVLGFTNGCWMPAYALVRESAGPVIAGTALGLLNFAFFAGAATFQQATGLLLGRFSPDAAGALPEAAYRTMFATFAVACAIGGSCVAATTRRVSRSGLAPADQG